MQVVHGIPTRAQIPIIPWGSHFHQTFISKLHGERVHVVIAQMIVM